MALLADTLLPASYKGVSFLVSNHTVNRGRKIVVHEFVNKEDETEDLGNTPRTFNVEAVIHGAFYYDNKRAFETALSTEGAGILQIGDSTYNCVAQPYTLTESISEIGVARYSLVFTEQKGISYPNASKSVASLVSNLANKIYDFARDDLNGQYIVTWVNNIDAAAQTLRTLTNTLNFISQSVGGNVDGKSDFEALARNTYDEAFSIAKNTGDIGGNIADLIFSFDGIDDDGETRFILSAGLFGFGGNDIFLVLDPNAENDQNIKNIKLTNGMINILALSNMYNAATAIDYLTTTDLDAVTKQLNDDYYELVNADYLSFSEGMLDQLNDIQVQSNIFFNQLRLTLYRIQQIEITNIPLTVLIYNYYGNEDNFETILRLNNLFNPSLTNPVPWRERWLINILEEQQ